MGWQGGMKEWQFNVLFFTGVGGAIFLMIAPLMGFDDLAANPASATGIGAILTYILTQRKNWTRENGKKSNGDRDE